MPEVSTALLDEIVRRLVVEFDPDRIILFGSRAWGEPREDSDIDLFIIIPENEERPLERATRAHRCLRGIGVPLDLIVRTREDSARFGRVQSSLEADILERGMSFMDETKMDETKRELVRGWLTKASAD